MKNAMKITALVCMALYLGQAAVLAAPQLEGYNNAGVQLNRTREYLERQRVARQIEEDRARQRAKVEGGEEADKQQEGADVRFLLNDVAFDASEVLSEEELRRIAAGYTGREIAIKELYRLVEEVNALYKEKGYLTCRAFLQPQTIKQGVVKITLIEGRTGEVRVQGNADTKERYITRRLHLTNGEIANINVLNKDLLLFNASNDAQLRIMMRAGEQPGTTDYVIAVFEPQRRSISVYGDNAGNDTSGEWRGGIFFNDRSLSGRRDSLSLSSIWSEGTKAFGGMYVTPVGRSGTKLGFNYSANSVHIVDGYLEDLQVRGHSSAYGVSLIQPLVVTDGMRSEASLGYSRQNSRTDVHSLDMPWVDDRVDGYTASFSLTNYGASSVIYQRHGYRLGSFDQLTGEDRNYGKYIFNGLYQKTYGHGQRLSARVDAQWSSTQYLASAEQFYIGGMTSVRGYKESLLGGDSGYSASLEYDVPLDKKRATSAFAFFDYGSVHGGSAFGNHVLAGTGAGVRARVSDKAYVSVTLGVPLRRDLNSTEVSKTRVHCLATAQF